MVSKDEVYEKLSNYIEIILIFTEVFSSQKEIKKIKKYLTQEEEETISEALWVFHEMCDYTILTGQDSGLTRYDD